MKTKMITFTLLAYNFTAVCSQAPQTLDMTRQDREQAEAMRTVIKRADRRICIQCGTSIGCCGCAGIMCMSTSPFLNALAIPACIAASLYCCSVKMALQERDDLVAEHNKLADRINNANKKK